MRSISRVVGVSINTVTKLLIDAGTACGKYHDKTVLKIESKRVQCDEIWSFTYAKRRNLGKATAAPAFAGDTWTWTAIDADTKLIISYLVGGRDTIDAKIFMNDLKHRLSGRVQLTTDGHVPYLKAIEDAFGADVDYAQIVKIYGEMSEKGISVFNVCTDITKKVIGGNPDYDYINTSHVERMNLSIRMGNRRFTRSTNAHSKRVENHLNMLSLYFLHYNFCRIHKSLKTSPAMAAGVSKTLHDFEWILELIDSAPPKKRGPYKKHFSN